MKKRPTDNKSQSSANEQGNSSIGAFPKRINTVTAGFLAALLEGHELDGMEAVFRQSTTRAAAWVHYLESKYGWHIERRDVADGTNDGRISWVTRYWLSAQDREAAFLGGAGDWVESVKAAAAKRRTKTPEVKAEAARLNARIAGGAA